MKNICLFIVCAVFVTFACSACNIQQSGSMIKSKRRFEKYLEPQKDSQSGMVDLSEGPRLKYDMNIGPNTPNFDIKIINPY